MRNRIARLAWLFLAPALLLAAAHIATPGEPRILNDVPPCEASALAVEPDGRVIVGDNEDHKNLYRLRQEDGAWVLAEPIEMPEGHRPRDIEAVASSAEGLVVVGSHGRKRSCSISPKRRRIRFLERRDDGLEESRFIESESHLDEALSDVEACVSKLFMRGGSDVSAFCRAAVEPKDGGLCAMDLSIEGAFVDADGRLWLGFRYPLVNGNAAIGRLAQDAEVLRLDELVTLDLGGRGVRELAFAGNLVYGLAGPPRDAPDPYALWSAGFPFAPSAPARVLAKDLPNSTEGLALLGDRALFVVDGAEADDPRFCKESSRYFERPLAPAGEAPARSRAP